MTIQTNYKSLFDRAVKIRLGINENLEQIESRVSHLRKGGQIHYEDLLLISDETLWPFSNFWRWPNRAQIEEKLKTTKDLLPRARRDEAAQIEVIKELYDIFRDISLVSIILRFVYPEDFGIHSMPVLEAAKSVRGKDDIEDYINYLRSLRMILSISEMRNRYAVKRVADVDMLLFAISQLRDYAHNEFNSIFAKYYKPKRTYLIEISADFQGIMDKYEKTLKGRVLDAMLHLSKNPFFAVGDTIKPLTKNQKGKWRYRIGDYRLIYIPEKEKNIVSLLGFGPRGSIYG
jgi:mRNA-degrading endonuclease RelE of RelBE toxin-antitoxin system